MKLGKLSLKAENLLNFWEFFSKTLVSIMTGPPTRGKKNYTTPRKSSNQDWEATEDSKPNEELSKFKEEVKKDMCDLQGDILDIRSM